MSKEQMDQLRQDWSKMCLGAASLVVEGSTVQILLQNMIELLCHQCEVMEDIRSELRKMNETNEPDSDAEPDPFQTLNGPAKKSTGCGAQLAIEGWGGFCGETDMGQTLPTLCVGCGGPFQTLNGPRL